MVRQDAFYKDFTPPWDIGRPQAAFVQLAEAGRIRGRVLDLGCGTGEHALFLAARGHEVWGIDVASTAIERARDKARERGLTVDFRVHSALELTSLGRTFETAIDIGLFHTFDADARTTYADQIALALAEGGRLHVLCFSEREPTTWLGPRRVTQGELVETFDRPGLAVVSVEEARFENTSSPGNAAWAWLAEIRRS